MSIPIKPISISLNPNAEKDDILLAFKLLFCFWKWKRGKAIKELENRFKQYFGAKYAFSFNSGRASLMAVLKSLDIKGEVLMQAFTCNAASNPVKWSGLKPVYVDVSDGFNMDPEDLRRKITSESRVVMVQHTFGFSAKIDEIKKICQENNLILIEDAAHALGAEYNNQKIGTFGKAAFFSFSRDKIISSVYGGMVVTNDDELAEKIRQFREQVKYPSYFWIKQQLLHPVLMHYLILPSYRVLGKYLLVSLQYLKILSKAVHWKEKKGRMPNYFPRRMPNALALLALNQFEKLNRFNSHRTKIADFYYNNLKGFDFLEAEKNTRPAFLRFPAKHEKAHEIIRKAWDNNLLIGDWYTCPVAPCDTDLKKVGYEKGACPNAERLAQITFNLPTHINISEKQAQKIINFLKREFQ